ncbi:MAG: aryl-sulfate sulfotransferase [Deltaproteobacteria bacterium]|nr:aryl-sulfate sulfotransferase [Deltaproteobacteria bacterium]
MNYQRRTLKGLTHYAPSRAYNGYNLFAPLYGRDVWLMDMEGRFVHRWKMPLTPGVDAELLPNGNLLWAGKVLPGVIPEFGGSGGLIMEVDWEGNEVWRYEDPYHSHVFHRLKNGNTIIARWEPIPHELSSRVQGGIPGTERDGVMWGCGLHEITPSGEVVWECPTYEKLDPEIDILCPCCPRDRWTNLNAVFELPSGDLLVSFRVIDTIAIIDKEERNIKWRWGPGEVAHQHNPTMLENGNILLFDNGAHRKVTWGNFSRVVEMNPETGEIVWEYRADPPGDLYTFVCGGAQRLPNGNTLICETCMGRFLEVTPAKEVAWEYVNPFYFDHHIYGRNNMAFRVYRYPPDFPGLEGKSLDPDKFSWINTIHGW